MYSETISMDMSMTQLLEHTDNIAVKELAADVFCEICKINEFRYQNRKHNKRVCKWCHDRLENPNLTDKSDQEIDEMRQAAANKIKDERGRAIVNTENLSVGFKF